MHKIFERENIVVLPLVALGLGRAVVEMAFKPMAKSLIHKVIPMPSQEEIDDLISANIQYFNTNEEPDDIVA